MSIREISEDLAAFYREQEAKRAARTKKVKKCTCGNPAKGYDCVCSWVAESPGKIKWKCPYCGEYEASLSKCDECEKTKTT